MDFGKSDISHKDITPEDWLMMYMEKEIDCVAVTDHNSGEWIDILKNTLATMDISKPTGYRKLYLFPGVEISANGNTHILALFDLSADTKKISTLLGSMDFHSEQFGTSNAVTEKSVQVVINKIHKAGGIAIPAHVDKPSGLFVEQKGNTLKQTLLDTEGLLAIELIDKSYQYPQIYIESKLNLTEVIGSDSHIKAQVGENYTWVKMGEPSLNALKLALHDKEDGIIRKDDIDESPNLIANRYFIKSISITNGFKAGNNNPLNGNFSPWLTSIIGGRGSGKSTVINYLRIALAKIADMPKEVQEQFDKFNNVGGKNSLGMLRNDTTIKVEIFKDGKLHLITWHQKTHTIQTLDNGNWNVATIVTNISELFPVQIFSQKELYTLTENPSKLIELIDSQFDKQAWTEARDKLIDKWLADRATERTLIKAISEEANLNAQLNSTNDKIILYEDSGYKDTLYNFNKLTTVNKFFVDSTLAINQFISELDSIEKAVPKIESADEINDVIVNETSEFLQTMNTTLATAKEKLSEAITLISPYKENLSTQFNALPWFAQFEEAKQAYETIESKILELGNETYEVLIQRRGLLSDKLSLIASQKMQLQILKQELHTLYELIIEKEKELRTERIAIIDRWKEFDKSENPFLIVELNPMADAESANISFRKLLRKETEFSNNIYSYDDKAEKCIGLIGEIINEPEQTRWEKRHSNIEKFISSSETDIKGLHKNLAKHIDGLRANTPEDIDRLMVWIPEDKLVLKFKKQGVEEDIQTGSAGERTAGMLGLLLALNNIPLAIDQPEDDLDSRLISSFVVPGFKTLKQNRQLILVTHNPNIAVNANSDNMVHMNFSSGQIIVEGNDALQNKDIRHAVCEVMEGGRDALNKRYYRISKALK